jgi:outer membrane receptor for monomeric catechols
MNILEKKNGIGNHVMNSEAIKYNLLFNNDIKNLPNDIQISTMTIICKINIIFNVENIAKYIDLSNNGIISVKYGKNNDNTTNRTILIKKRNNKNEKKKKKGFYNQVSLQVKTKNEGIVNIKLFLNGSIQMTGCKNDEFVSYAIEKVFSELRVVKAIPNYKTGKIEEKRFIMADTFDDLRVEKLYNFKICMINSNFKIGFQINRDNLFEILLKDNIKCSYDPIIHACVNIKYENN